MAVCLLGRNCSVLWGADGLPRGVGLLGDPILLAGIEGAGQVVVYGQVIKFILTMAVLCDRSRAK